MAECSYNNNLFIDTCLRVCGLESSTKMLIKEYRIPLPMTVEEYRIAQLYMIAKKSREESKVSESGKN